MNGTRVTVEHLFEQLGAGASPAEVAEHFHEDVDWFIAGDTSVVPWIGRKTGRAGVAEFYQQLRDLTRPVEFVIERTVVEGPNAVVLGHLVTEIPATGKRIESEFAFDIQVHDGLISRYHMFEDTWAVTNALR